MQRHPSPQKLEKNLLDVAVQRGLLELYNGLVDKSGSVRKRPGLFFNQQLTAPQGVQAIYWWPSKQKLVAVAAGRVYAADSPSSTLTRVSDDFSVLALGPAKIVDTGRWLYICSTSGRMIQWNGTDAATYVPDGVAPTNVSTITTLNQRVVANELGTNRFWFTKPPSLTDPDLALEWDSYVGVGRNNEEVIGLDVAGGELIVFKRDTITAYFDDGTTPYKPITGSQQAYGLISASAIATYNNALFFVSPDRTIRRLFNREIVDVSTPKLGRALDKLRNAGEAIVFVIDRLVLFTFPDDEKTFVFDPNLNAWSQFTTHYSGLQRDFFARCATTLPAAGQTNMWLLGCKDGSVNYWDSAAYSDAGNPITFLMRTPHQDWGTSNRKHTTRLVVKVSTETLRDLEIPEINFPPATRCVIYSESVTLPTGVTATVSGLPAGFTATQVGTTLTLAGITGSFAGSQPIQILLKDARGAVFTLDKTFIVNDFDIEIGVL